MLHLTAPVSLRASAAGTVTAISTFAGITPEACANEAGPRWYQLYAADRNAARASIQRAKAAEFEALVVTMDSPTMGNRKRDSGTAAAELSLRNAFRLAPQVVTHPRWFARMAVRTVTALRSSPAPAGPTRPRSQTSGGTSQVHDGHAVPQRVSPFTWADLEWIRAEWSGPLLVKGVLSGHDASQSVELGADAVIVSNHGGRQLEGAPATLTVLPEIVDAVGSRVDVLFDGGIRRGSDIVKALALGARAVMIGRPYLYGLAGAGEAGVARILEILRSEMVRTMQLMGCHDIATLDASWLTTSDAFAPSFASSQLAHSLPNHLKRFRSKDT